MQCEIQGLTDMAEAARSSSSDTLPRPGRVNEVCKEWLVHEDGALAYRMQHDEFTQHYSGNKVRNAQVRSDAPAARAEQDREVEEAQAMQAFYERMMHEQAQADAMVAHRVAQELEREEREKLRLIENRDKELARKLEEQERASKSQPCSPNYEDRLAVQMRASSVSDPSDLSDFCLQPAPGMTLEETRRLQEEQDAELARLLQEQEGKRRGKGPDDQLFQDRLIAMEYQDRELARLLQEQERAKARKAREKARQKLLQKRQQQELREEGEVVVEDLSDDVSPVREVQLTTTTAPVRPHELDLTRVGSRTSKTKPRFPDPEAIETLPPTPEPASTLPNIAMAIDPTYNRRHVNGETPRSPPPSNVSSPALSLPPPDFDDDEDDDNPAPPYMPIQGQRRMSSLEKKTKKGKTKKDGREGCKQQ